MREKLALALLPGLALSALAQNTIRLTTVEDIFVDGVMDEAWSNLSFGYTSVSRTPETLCYDLEPYGAVSFGRDRDRIWVSSYTYLEAIIKLQGAVDLMVSLEGLDGGMSVATEPVSVLEILVASKPDDEDVLEELMSGDYVDLRVRLKDLLGEVDAEAVPLTQIVLTAIPAGEDAETEGSEEKAAEASAQLCVAGVAIID